ncbi:MAG: phosphoribosylformylglycinamidine cyclo-ligase [Synechococcaceae cyanobacterium SM2_3_2]|nr:phosphoribosylformylglycinamidine cyclo-ligase [Synechococcaceae cyanobacterium SM2_3_2]
MDYRSAGVDTSRGQDFVKAIARRLDSAKTQGVLGKLGGFAGLFELPSGYHQPVLVSGTDGVGTKLKVAQACGQHRGVGIDLVAMCVNDVVTVGAKPLFFLDYIATAQLDPEALIQVIDGIVAGCEQAGCALLGGETAEMPGFYRPQEYDLAGFCVGIGEKSALIDPAQNVQIGDRLLGIPSSGLHSNGFSLVRKIIAAQNLTWSHRPAGWAQDLGQSTLIPTRIYVPEILASLSAGLAIHGMAHITGGGLPENLPRALASDQSAQVDPTRWQIPDIFGWLQQQGSVASPDMFSTFNMGIGFVIMVPPDQVSQAQRLIPDAIDIGAVVEGTGEVIWS